MVSRLPNPVPLPKRHDFGINVTIFGGNVTILAATSLTLTSTLTADYVIVLLWNFVLFLLDTITYHLPLNIHSHVSPWLSRLGRHSSKPEVVGSNPAVGKNFSFCNSRSLRVADTSNQSIQMKSTVAYT